MTGAGVGIGRGVLIKLAEEVARVGALDVNLETAKETEALIANAGGEALALLTNVADEAQVADATGKVEKQFVDWTRSFRMP